MKQLHIIVGGSGSGKTTRLYQELFSVAEADSKKQCFLLVPEQYTLQAQRDVVHYSKHHGTLNIDVLSFIRLCHRIFEELGTHVSAVLEDYGKSMLLRRVLGEVEQELLLYRNMKDKAGFLDQLKSVLSEFYQYDMSEEKLKEVLASMEENSLLAYKLHDLLLIYAGFAGALGEQYLVAEQLPELFCQVAGESKLLRDANFYFDGFTGFTPIQYKVIVKLMELGAECFFTITMDENVLLRKRSGSKYMFALSRETYDSLLTCYASLQEKEGCEDVDIISLFDVSNSRFGSAPDLALLERCLFRERSLPDITVEASHVEVFEAANMKAELAAVAQRIDTLVLEEGFRYRDIAVVSGDEEAYGKLIERIFPQYHIPYFLDHNHAIMNHPVVEALRAVLAIVCMEGQGYTYDRMMRYVNTGLAGIDKRRSQKLNDYLVATGVIGFYPWRDGFLKVPRSYYVRAKEQEARQRQLQRKDNYLAQMNRIRGRVMSKLLPLQEVISSGATVRDKAAAIYQYMVDMRYETYLKQRAKELNEEGDYVNAKVWQNIYGAMIGLLDKLVSLLGEVCLPNSELCAILDAGLSELALGSIPPAMDEVLVGDLTRTRLGKIKALFVLGVNDTNLPVNQGSPNLISDRDRITLDKGRLHLAPNRSVLAYQEQFYLYQMLTKPSARLIVSYARMNLSGGAMRPAYLIERLRTVFPKLSVRSVTRECYLCSEESIHNILARGLRQYEELSEEEQYEFLTLYQLVSQKEEYQPILKECLKALSLGGEMEQLGQELALRLFGKRLVLSVTRLENYSGCAYAHFLNYGLKLKEQETADIVSADFGTIMHKVVELFTRRMKEEEVSYAALTQADFVSRASDCVKEAMLSEGYDFTEETARNRYVEQTVMRMAKRNLLMLCRHINLGNFVPQDFEITFGDDGELDAPVYELDNGGQISLKGTIDRVDTYEASDGLVYLKIIDYKTGSTKLDLTKVYYGLQLQLLTYLLVAKQSYPAGAEKVAAAALYYHIKDPVMDYENAGTESMEDDAAYRKMVNDTFKQNGVVLADDIVVGNMEKAVLENKERYQCESIPVAYTKDGEFTKTSRVYDREQMRELLFHTEQQIESLGQRMLLGEIAPEPYRYQKTGSCTYCPYSGICQITENESCVRRLETKTMEDFQIEA